MEDVIDETNTKLGNSTPATSIDDDEIKVTYKTEIDEDHEEFLELSPHSKSLKERHVEFNNKDHNQEKVKEEELDENLGSTTPICSNTIKGARTGGGHSLRRHLKYLFEYNEHIMYNITHSGSLIPNDLDIKYYAQILTRFLVNGKWELINSKIDLCNEVLKNWFKNNNNTIYVTDISNKIEYIHFKPDKSTEIEDFQKIAEIKLNVAHGNLFAEVDDVKVTLKKGQNIFTSLEIYYKNEVSGNLVMFKLFYIDPLELCLSYILQTNEKKSVEHLHSPLCINCPFPEIFELCTVESIKSKLIQLKINGDLELAKNHFKRISKNVLEMSTFVTKFAYSTEMFTFTLRDISTHKVNNCISPTIEIKFEGKENFKYNTIKFRYCDGSTPSPNGQSTTYVVDQSE